MNPIKINNIYQTQCICFPRSGHLALYTVLQHYFGSDLVYRDAHKGRLLGSDGNYEKNHDFELSVPIKDSIRYLIQVRNPLDSLASWHALNRRSTGDAAAGNLADWSAERLPYWSGFVKKWLYGPPISLRLVVHYEDLLARPLEVVSEVVQFMAGTVDLNYHKLQEVLKEFPLQARQNGRTYAYQKA